MIYIPTDNISVIERRLLIMSIAGNKTVKPSANVSFPVESDYSGLIEVRDHNVVAGIVNRNKAAFLGDWNSNRKQGVYVLLSDVTDGSFTMYVGYTSGDFQQRFTRDHLKTKDFWSRAVMFVPASEHGISSTEALWLEGHVVDLFSGSGNVRLANIKHTGDRSIRDTDLYGLHMIAESIMRVLSLLGYVPNKAGVASEQGNKPSNTVNSSRISSSPSNSVNSEPLNTEKEYTKPAVAAVPPVILGKPSVVNGPPAAIKSNPLPEKDNSKVTTVVQTSAPASEKDTPQREADKEVTPEAKKSGFLGLFRSKEKTQPPAAPKVKKVNLSDEEKFNRLRKWRIEEMHKFTYAAPYYVFDDLTLKEIIRVNPKNKNQLITVSGIGDVKLQRHGESLLGALKEM